MSCGKQYCSTRVTRSERRKGANGVGGGNGDGDGVKSLFTLPLHSRKFVKISELKISRYLDNKKYFFFS